MGALTLGGCVKGTDIEPELPGMWATWSLAGEVPGGYFLTPADEPARSIGIKYVVIRAKQLRGEAHPHLALVRTDPHNPDLLEGKP